MVYTQKCSNIWGKGHYDTSTYFSDLTSSSVAVLLTLFRRELPEYRRNRWVLNKTFTLALLKLFFFFLNLLTLWKVVLLVLVLRSAVTVGRMHLDLTEREEASAHGTFYMRGNGRHPRLLLTWTLLLHPLLSFSWWIRHFVHLHDIGLCLQLRLKTRIVRGSRKRFV